MKLFEELVHFSYESRLFAASRRLSLLPVAQV